MNACLGNRFCISTATAISQGIIDLIGTIMVYKFTNLSRQEINAMLGITLQETRVYREAREEGREEGREEAREEEREKIALNLLLKNMPLETIAEVTGLTIEQIQQLQLSNTNDRS
jgi:predicted transposase/invertase (TIGR01784 family)